MASEDFEGVLQNRISQMQSTLSGKAKEYASNDDRLYNFRRTAEINGVTMEKALWGMASKHLVSVIDLVESPEAATRELIDEKCGDLINYLVLLEAVLIERINREDKTND